MKELIGIIHFNNPIPCQGDVLGCTYDTNINNVKVSLAFPELNVVSKDIVDYKLNIHVEKPKIWRATREDRWGNVTSYRKEQYVGTRISQIVIIFQYNEEDLEITVKQVCDKINEWRAQLYERIQLLGKPIIVAKNIDHFEREGKAMGFELCKKDDYSLVQTNSMGNIGGTIYTIDYYLSHDEINRIFKEIDTSKQLKAEYDLYSRALLEKELGNTRYAILNATTACELCVTQIIQTRCSELGIKGKELCDKFYRSMGDRFNLLECLGVTLASSNPTKEIVNPRNNLFHNRTIVPTLGECSSVLNAVRKYLDAYIPEMYE